MATAAEDRTPVHLWVVGILATLWNAYGCYDYLMTETGDQAYLAQFGPEMIAYWNGLPGWLTAFWALGVWGGLAGALLLLLRSRYSVWAFAASLIGVVVAFGYQLLMTDMPASLTRGLIGVMPYVVTIIAALLLWYSWSMENKGALR